MPSAVIKEIGGNRTAVIDPRREYLTGGVLSAVGNGARTLSSEVDDVMREVSPKVYEQMLTDPEIAKCINILKISTLGDGVTLVPAIPEAETGHDEAVIIADFCETAIKGLENPLRDTLEQMMDAMIYGHKIAEITYKNTAINGYIGDFLVPDKIKVKARDVAKFVVDNKMNIIGLVGRIDQGNYKDNLFPTPTPDGTPESLIPKNQKGSVLRLVGSQTGTGGEPLKITVGNDGRALINGRPVLPREKFLVLTMRGRDEDPRGTSILRPAFNSWHLKTQIWPEYLRYLLMCAIPLLVGYTPDDNAGGGQKELLRGTDGNPVRDSEGRFVEANPVEALRDALLQARNATTLALKGGSKVQEIGAQGAGTPFFKAIEIFDRQMEAGVLLQTLASSEGIHQNRAAAQTHMTILDQLVWWLKGVVADMLVSDLLRPLIRYNFGDDALELVPQVSLGDTERRDFATDSAAVAVLYKAGYLQPDQLKQTDAMLGLAIRRTVDPLLLIQQLQAAGVPITAVPPPPTHEAQVQAGPGGGSTPVPITPSAAAIAGGRTDSTQALGTTARTVSKKPSKFPATGRIKSRINKAPANAENPATINVTPQKAA